MKLTFLGTGSAMPTGTRAQTGLLLRTDAGRLLVDCGSGVSSALARTPVGYEGVDAVLLTHHHLDHVSDLMVFLKARWLAGETAITVVGPPGTGDLIDDLLDVHDYMQDRLDLTVRDVTPDHAPFDLAGFAVDAMETRHSMYCHAYRFEPAGGGPAVTFSGDTEAFGDLIDFADGAAVLVHDCSFPDDVDVSNHPTPESLGRALGERDADLGLVSLSHLYPHTEGRHEEMLDSIADRYDGAVRVAEDGVTIEFD